MHRLVAGALALPCSLFPLPAQQLQFMPASPRAPTSVLQGGVVNFVGYAAVDDIDGDGHPDALVPYPNGLGVYLGTATGPMLPVTVLQWAGQRPVLVDLDGDGDRDLALVPPLPGQAMPVVLYVNTPTGLQPGPQVMAGVPVQGAAFGDVDGDGFVDLLLAVTVGSPLQSIVLARGGPGLQFTSDLAATPTGLPQGLWPVLLDADGDGDLDVLAGNTTSGLRLLRNTGGSFADATAALPPTPTGQTFLAAADLDGDGHTDCARVVNSRDIEVLWGSPAGLTVAPVVATIVSTQSLLPADFDGDGDVDLLVDSSGGLEVLWTQGLRQFTRTALAPPGTVMRGTGDVDGDGANDVVFTQATEPRTVRCKHHARFEDAAFLHRLPPRPYGPGAPMAGDVDGDGRTDVVTVSAGAIFVDRALGGGVYSQSTSVINFIPPVSEIRSELADVDGDADLDVVAKTDAELLIATNNGSGTFTLAMRRQSLAVPSYRNLRDDLRVADLDADGDAEVVVADDRGIVLFRRIPGTFAEVTVVPATMATLLVELADVDGDGDLDVICDARAGLTNVIVANNGSGIFSSNAAFQVDLGPVPHSVRAGDLDADGDADLVVAESGTLRVYRNDGSGLFTETTLADVVTQPYGVNSNVAVADLDCDRDLDVAVHRHSGTTPIILLLNDGSGRLHDHSAARAQQIIVSADPVVLRAEDLDDDGDDDLVLNNYSQHQMLTNHVRQLRSPVLPQLGGVAAFELMSGPGFGQAGLAALGFAPALAATPLHVPGLLGTLHVDPASLQILSVVLTSQVGVSTVFVSVPQDPVLFGAEVWFQGAVLPATDLPGFTNSVYEAVLR